MTNFKYRRLFEPIEVAGEVFRNRLFAAPEGYYKVGGDCLPGNDEAAFFERKAMGGFASVCVGDCIVESATGTHYPFLIRMEDPDTLPWLAAMAGAIRRHGAVASAELSHAGMYAEHVKKSGGTLYGPVAVPDSKYGEVREMPEDMILHIIESFGNAAAWAKRCGFGMVTLHAGHGWLLSQFMSPSLNTRSDMWGGSFENRMRLTLSAIESIRRNVGSKFPIEVRMSGSECHPKGYDIDEGIRIAKALDGIADIIHVSAGHHENHEAFMITHPSMFMPDGVNVKYAAEIKKHVKMPVATVGALTDPAMMEEILASGQADILELGRQTLADPDLPIKARAGRDDEIAKCMRCCTCFFGCGAYRTPQCAINPIIGRELDEKYALPAARKKRVLVAGGGIGGMQAALTAAKMGHEVLLHEKSGELGGVLLCESGVPFKKRLSEYIKRQIMLISRERIDVKLNSPVTPESAEALAPDVIVAALGSRAAVPSVPGIDGSGGIDVFAADDVYRSPDRAGKRLVILGGGLVGLELAVYMAGRGHIVTVVELTDAFAVDPFGMHGDAIMGEFRRLGVATLLSTRTTGITPEGVAIVGAGGPSILPADTVVYATGQKPLRSDAFALSYCAPEFHQIGDCRTPRSIIAATQEAYTIARNIGRVF